MHLVVSTSAPRGEHAYAGPDAQDALMYLANFHKANGQLAEAHLEMRARMQCARVL